ncbi:hypothetical protein JAAARDRAFT_129670, partial [Jaapia argillacea MUCL 33604]
PLRGEITLASVDGGYSAWSFLFAAALVEAIVWSIPFSYGIFLTEYLQEPMLASQPHASTLLPLVGTLSSGIIYCSGPLVYPYMTRFPRHRRPLMWAGTFLCWISLFGASYTRKVTALVLLQGALYAIGGALIYPPCISYMSEWFVRRRGLANGVLFAGTAAGGLVLPFILPPLLSAYGIFSTLRIISIAILILLVLSLFFIKPRLPENRVRGPLRRNEASVVWIRSWSWWSLVIANTMQGFAFFVPLLWVPTFASALHLRSSTSSLALSLLNGSSALGPLLVGALSDHFTPWPIALITAALSCVCTLVFWGAIGNVAGLMLFGAAYGIVAGGWSTLWSNFVVRISKEDPSLSMSLYGFLMLSRGLGNVLSTPISTSLANISPMVSGMGSGKTGFAIDEGRFDRLIIYCGACYAVVAAVALVGWIRETVTTRVEIQVSEPV